MKFFGCRAFLLREARRGGGVESENWNSFFSSGTKDRGGGKKKKKNYRERGGSRYIRNGSDRRATMKISSLIVSSRVAVNRAAYLFPPLGLEDGPFDRNRATLSSTGERVQTLANTRLNENRKEGRRLRLVSIFICCLVTNLRFWC